MDRVIALRQISVTALFYLEDSRRIHPRSVRACQPKDLKRREWRSTLGRERGRAHACGEKESHSIFVCLSVVNFFSSVNCLFMSFAYFSTSFLFSVP